MVPDFIEIMKEAHKALRRIVGAVAASDGLPTPALSSALGYFDSYRQGLRHVEPHPGAARLRRARLRARS